MEIKFNYNTNNIQINATFENFEDYYAFVNNLPGDVNYITDNVKPQILTTSETKESEETKPTEEKPIEKEIKLASDGQKRYMDKLGIEYTDQTTSVEAIDLINAYKTAHNIPLNQRKQ